MTWREAIEKVLREAPGAMHYTEIAEKISEEELVKSKGATPGATIIAELRGSMKDKAKKVGRGMYVWINNDNNGIQVANSTEDKIEKIEEDQYDVITSFGMYWRRNAIVWDSNPKLWGIQSGGSKVNLSDQIGVYLLYDGREVIYTGMADKRRLGKRLGDHTRDRLATRWDRFSWFGMLPVSDDGKLGSLVDSISTNKILLALEAVLIEALEPRQNRRQGDGLRGVEFAQNEDPSITKKALIKALEGLPG
ncbi:hypothetical protein KQI52_14315 [bacterium]|nr:hypothetical protein [bacterium]